MKKTIGTVISNGWALRNLLETEMLEKSGLKAMTLFLVDKKIENNAIKYLNMYSCNYVVVSIAEPKWLLVLKSFILHLKVFVNSPNYSINKFRSPVQRVLLYFLNFLKSIRLIKFTDNVTTFAYEFALSYESKKLQIPDIDCFLSVSPNSLEDHLLVSWSKRSKIPVVNVILSWDNIFAKGFMHTANLYVAWGEVMKQQIIRLFRVTESQILVFGAPHIGGIIQNPLKENDQNTILYSTASRKHFPDEIDLVTKLADLFKSGNFTGYSRLLVRTHPADSFNAYNSIHEPSKGVYVYHPTTFGNTSIKDWIPKDNELKKLGEQLKDVSISVNLASTMTLDSLVNGIPVINITTSLNGRSLYRHYLSEHYQEIINLDLVKLAYSFDHLVQSINVINKNTSSVRQSNVDLLIRPTSAQAFQELHDAVIVLIQGP